MTQRYLKIDGKYWLDKFERKCLSFAIGQAENEIHNIKECAYKAINNNNETQFLELLLQNHSLAKIELDHGRICLHYSVRKGWFITSEMLIVFGSLVSLSDCEGETPLHLCRSFPMANLLIDKKANVNSRNIYGQTPLHMCNDVDLGRLLLQSGADVNATDNEKRTPLHLCSSAIMMRMLLESGANVKAKDINKRTPLHSCIERIWKKYEEELNMPIFDSDGDEVAGSSIDEYDRRIWINLESETSSMAQLLIENGAVVNAVDNQLRTPLHLLMDIAWDNYQEKKIKWQDLSYSEEESMIKSPEESVEAYNPFNTNIYKVLMTNGAEIKLKDKKSITPYDYAMKRQKRKSKCSKKMENTSESCDNNDDNIPF